MFFAANTTVQTFPLTILDDTQEDPNETFDIVFTSESPFFEPSTTTTITIDDDESGPPPGSSALSINSPVITEGSCRNISGPDPCGSLFTVTFDITLDAANAGDISMDYETDAITATEGVDYTPISGTFTIPAGDTSTTLSVDIIADRAVEGDEDGNEFFELFLSNPVGNVNVIENRGRATIRDDDYVGQAFGVSGSDIFRRALESDVESDSALLGLPRNPTALEFESFQFDTLFGWDANALIRVSLSNADSAVVADVSAPVSNVGEQWTGLAYDHTNGVAVGVANTGLVAEVDLTDGSLSVQSTLTPAWQAVAIHPTTGRVYAVAPDGSGGADLYRLDRVGGGWQELLLGNLDDVVRGLASDDDRWDADFDDGTGDLYINALEDDGGGGSALVTRLIDLDPSATPGDPIESRVVVSGTSASALAVATTPTPPSVLWTSDFQFTSTPPDAVQLVAESPALDNTGIGLTVSGVGDVNGDTFEDVAIAAPDADVDDLAGAGKVFVIYGGPSSDMSAILEQLQQDVTLGDSLLDGDNGFLVNGNAAGQRLGTSVTGAGFMNNDRNADFAVGFVEDGTERGGAFLIFGSDVLPAVLDVAEVGDTNNGATVAGVVITGAANGDRAGAALAGAGDFTGNGFNDLLVGAPNWNSGFGAGHVIFGSALGVGSGSTVQLRHAGQRGRRQHPPRYQRCGLRQRWLQPHRHPHRQHQFRYQRHQPRGYRHHAARPGPWTTGRLRRPLPQPHPRGAQPTGRRG